MLPVIVDVHTHVFPPRMIAARSELASTDPGFAELYGDPAARMASADDLLDSMAGAGVDVSVAAGFAWRSAEHAEEHAAYLLEAARRAGGGLLAFPPLPALGGPGELVDEGALLARCAELRSAGARGLGELRWDAETLPLADGRAAEEARAVLRAARAAGLALLAHCTEPAGHAYAGKEGGLSPRALWLLLSGEPGPQAGAPPVIAAHWGGGLPLYALMPEVRELLDRGVLAVDTAASRYLYDPAIVEVAQSLGLARSVLWGSDYPLRPQGRDRRELERAVADPLAREALLGGNARRLLGL